MMAVKEDRHGTWKNRIESIFYVPELMDILQNILQHGPVKKQYFRALDNCPSGPGPMYYPELRVASISPEITVPYFGDPYSFSVCHFAAVLSIEEYFRNEVDLPGRDAATKDGSLVSGPIKVLSVCRTDSPILTSFTNYTAILRRILQHGCSPNQAGSCDSKSLWVLFVYTFTVLLVFNSSLTLHLCN
jgi:hypothetical protein